MTQRTAAPPRLVREGTAPTNGVPKVLAVQNVPGAVTLGNGTSALGAVWAAVSLSLVAI